MTIGHDSILSAITHKLNVSGHMLIWTFSLVLVSGTYAQNLSTPFSYTLHSLASSSFVKYHTKHIPCV
jgi:hypothetical protein